MTRADPKRHGEPARPTPILPDGDISAAQAWQEFVSFLRRRGDRATSSRRLVLEHALGRHDHFRAEEAAAALAGRVSRGTVYRTLARLVEAGLLRAIRDDGAHLHYEHTAGHIHHEHMICESCGSFTEFDDRDLDDRLAAAARRHGFTARRHRLTLFGICGKCARRGT